MTDTAALPLLPSEVAVIVAKPALTPATLPVAETVATVGALVAQVTGRPSSRLPAWSRVTAVNCRDSRTTSDRSPGETVTDATGEAWLGVGGEGSLVVDEPPPPPHDPRQSTTTLAIESRRAFFVMIASHSPYRLS